MGSLSRFGWIAVMVVSPVAAELPGLGEKKWLGHFIGFEHKKFSYGLTVKGKSSVKIMGPKDLPLSQKLAIQVDFVVDEILPDGKTYARPVVPESLESSQVAGNKPQNVVIRGKVKGDVGFEIFVNEDRGVIALGGRLAGAKTLVKNPLRFSIRVKFPKAYPFSKRGGDREREKAFEEKIRNDRILITWTDGKRVKQTTKKAVAAGSAEVNGPGVSAMEVEFSSYGGKKIECVASANSVMTLSGGPAAPLHDGFILTWVADLAKDPECKARLSLSVR